MAVIPTSDIHRDDLRTTVQMISLFNCVQHMVTKNFNSWSHHVLMKRQPDSVAVDQMDVFTVNKTLLDSYPHTL